METEKEMIVVSNNHLRDCFAHFHPSNSAIRDSRKKKGFNRKNGKPPSCGMTAYAFIESGGLNKLLGTTSAQLKN